MKAFFAFVLAGMLAGCSTIGSGLESVGRSLQGSNGTNVASTAGASTARQLGYRSIEIVPAIYDSKNSIFTGLESTTDENKVRERAQTLGRKVYEGNLAGKTNLVEKETSYLVYLIGDSNSPIPSSAVFKSWKVVGGQLATNSAMEDVTGKVGATGFVLDPAAGKIHRVFRITTKEKVSMVSVQMSNEVLKGLRYIAICPEDQARKHFPGRDRATWMNQTYIAALPTTNTHIWVPVILKE